MDFQKGNMYSIEAIALSHQFTRGELVLDGVDLRVRTGSISGFLGPNGAGKTTTLRLILGLLKKQQGDILIFGQPFDRRNRIAALNKIGSLIEMPSVYSHLTAVENLMVWQRIYRCPKKRVQDVLQRVGLAGTGAKKAGQFSLGMKQRLGIAVALLNEPALLVLDEPTNGLDPSGIVEIRELLKTLNKEHGITILISSHLLPEIEKIATDIAIIHKGRMLFQGLLNELMERRRQASSIAFETSDHARALQTALLRQPATRQENGKIILPAVDQPAIAALNRELVQNGIDVYGITTLENDLESIFMQLTNVES